MRRLRRADLEASNSASVAFTWHRPIARRRLGARRLVGDRRAQVAQRPVRRRRRVLRASRLAPGRARDPLGLPHPRRPDAGRDPLDWTPEHSRRARGFSTYAALRSLGRSGVAELVERTCARARALADALAELPGCEILNEVVLNQVLFRFEDDEATDAFIAAVQDAGEAWLGGTLWDGRRAVRLSVSCWRTSEDDVLRAAAAFAAARASTARVGV